MSESGKKSEQSVAADNASQDYGSETRPGPSARVEIPDPPTPDKNTAEKGKKAHEWVRTVLTGLAFLVSIYALNVSKGSRDAAQQSASAATRSAGASERSALAAEHSSTAAQKNVETATRQLELSQRPWISVDIVAVTPLTVDGNGIHMQAVFTLRNIGHSPASYIRFRETTLLMVDRRDIYVEQKKICDPLRNQPNDSSRGERTLLPGEQYVELTQVGLKKIDFDKARQQLTNRAFVLLVVTGCVDYQFTFQEGHHQRGFTYWTVKANPKGPGALGINLDDGMPIPAEQIGFYPDLYGYYAD